MMLRQLLLFLVLYSEIIFASENTDQPNNNEAEINQITDVYLNLYKTIKKTSFTQSDLSTLIKKIKERLNVAEYDNAILLDVQPQKETVENIVTNQEEIEEVLLTEEDVLEIDRNGSATKPCINCELPGLHGGYPNKLCYLAHELRNAKRGRPLSRNRMLFDGPPGNSKTEAAKAFALLANAEFVELEGGGGTVVQRYAGQGPLAIKELFAGAINKTLDEGGNAVKPVVIFIDEIDAIAQNDNSHDAKDYHNSLTTLWCLLDSYRNNPFIFFICSTNNCEKFEPPFIDRFRADIHKFENPDDNKRKFYLKKFFLANCITRLTNDDLKTLSTLTDGFSIRALELLSKRVYDEKKYNPTSKLTLETIKKLIEELKRSLPKTSKQ